MALSIDAALPSVWKVFCDGLAEHRLWGASEYPFCLSLCFLHRLILDTTHLFLQKGKQKEVTRGQIRAVWRVGYPVEVSQFDSCGIGSVWAGVVMMEPQIPEIRSDDICLPQAWSFLPDGVLQSVQDVTVPLCIDCSLSKLNVDQSTTVKECCHHRLADSSGSQGLLWSDFGLFGQLV